MEDFDIIQPVDEPNDWVNELVIVEKPNGKSQICPPQQKEKKNIKKFSFRPVTTDQVKKVIKDLKTNKSVDGEISIQILKES